MTTVMTQDTKMMHHYGDNLVKVDEQTSLTQWAAEVGLNYEVTKKPIEIEGRVYPKYQALVRSDNDAVLDVVSPKFKYPQPIEILNFFDDLIREQQWQIEAAGSTMEGRRIWTIAKVGNRTELGGVDPIEGRALFFMTYHKGLAGSIMFLNERLYCTNQLPYLTTGGGKHRAASFKSLPHYREYNPDAIRAELGLQPTVWAENVHRLQQYTTVPMPKAERRAFWADVLNFPLADWREREDDRLPHAEKRLDRLEAYAVNSPGAALSTAKDTLWGAVNALTYWTDHDRRSRGRDGTGRLNAVWWGSGANLKDRAIAAANRIIEVAA